MNENLHTAMKGHERRYIIQVLYSWDWNKPKTAKALGIALSSLYRKIKELGIEKGA